MAINRRIKWMRFSGMTHFWLGIQKDFMSDTYIIGLLFIYFRIPYEYVWRFKYWLNVKRGQQRRQGFH